MKQIRVTSNCESVVSKIQKAYKKKFGMTISFPTVCNLAIAHGADNTAKKLNCEDLVRQMRATK